MDKKSVEELEARFKELLQNSPYPVDEMIEIIQNVPSGKGEEFALSLLKALSDAADFEGAFKLVSACYANLSGKLQGVAVRDALKKTTKDRLILSFIEGVGFDVRPIKESVGRLGRLLSFHKGALVLSAAWGLGEVRALDYFYRRVTVDFRVRRGHQFTYDAACETLVPAPENHILVTQRADPARIEQMLKSKPGEFVKEMLRSFGDMPVTRLEELAAQHGFVKAANWKKFWDGARAELRKDKCVEIPTRRAEPIHIKAAAEDYGQGWFTAFAQMKEPKSILSSVREIQGKDLDDEKRAKISDRLTFALKGARGVDDALYARIAFCMAEMEVAPEAVAKARRYLWEASFSGESRYLAAARTLPARDMEALVKFLTKDEADVKPVSDVAPVVETAESTEVAVDEVTEVAEVTEAAEAAESSEVAEVVETAEVLKPKNKLFAVLPQMCFPLLSATVEEFINDADCEEAVAALLKQPEAPATLVTLVLGRYEEFSHWTKLPPLVVILTHAIALGEGKQGGETLRMQNVIRRLFADQKWLEGILTKLQSADQALVFERFQASIAWDPSTHHLIVVRMTKIVPELAARQIKKVEVQKIERITSLRSYAERQAAYEKLVKVEIPENTKRIEFAKSYGDLSENAEYQYAKDEQRALMQKESLLQKDLNEVKAVDFADVVAPNEVCPGAMVEIATASGEEIVYTVLGEWDNNFDLGVISNKTKLAQNMLGKKVGDTFDLPDAEGNVTTATIKAVSPLTDEMRAWLKEVPAAI